MKKAISLSIFGLLLAPALFAGGRPKGGVPKAGTVVRVAGPKPTPGAKVKAPAAPVNLNSATLTELMTLPKVGAKTAERIVKWRKEHGGFRRPEELMHVKGIGEKGFQRLKAHLVVTSAAARVAPSTK